MNVAGTEAKIVGAVLSEIDRLRGDGRPCGGDNEKNDDRPHRSGPVSETGG
jgi:hypothetical protein